MVVRCLGVDIGGMPRSAQFLLLSAGVMLFFTLNGFVEEQIFKVLPRFEYGWYLTAFELVNFAIFALAERYYRQEKRPLQHNAGLRYHWAVAAYMCLSRGLTNVSLQYMNYPTQIIFKNMKLLPVMIVSVFMLGKRYAVSEYVIAVMFVSSAAFFSLGDVDASPDFEYLGVFVVLLSLVFDGLHSTSQEQLLRKHGSSVPEMMVFTNMFSAVLVLGVCVLSGELGPSLAYCAQYPEAYFYFTARSVLVYLGVLCFANLVDVFDAVSATTVTTLRKVLSILCSFALFPKPFTGKHLLGLLVFTAAVGIKLRSLQQEKEQRMLQELLRQKEDDLPADMEKGRVAGGQASVEMSRPAGAALEDQNAVDGI